MELDSRLYGVSPNNTGSQRFEYAAWQKDLNPRIQERGYCPIKNGKVLGRYRHYAVAEQVPHDIIVAYRDLDRFGYAESGRNWLQEMIDKANKEKKGNKNVTRNR